MRKTYSNLIKLFIVALTFILGANPVIAAAPIIVKTSPLPPSVSNTTNMGDKIELKELKTEFSNIYQMKDGSKKLEVYSSPANYQTNIDGKNVWQNINTDFKLSSNGYTNTSGKVNFNLPFNLLKSPVVVDDGVHKVSMSLVTNATSPILLPFFKPVVNKNQITYIQALPNANVSYYSTETGLKEYIVLNKPVENPTYKFILELTNLAIVQNGSSFDLNDKDSGALVYHIPNFSMWDKKGGDNNLSNEYSEDIQTSLVNMGNKYELTVKPSSEWINSPNRVFPITIDPSFQVYFNYGEDTYTQSGSRYTRAWDQKRLYVGNMSSKGLMRTFTPFNIPDITNARIFSANFSVKQLACEGSCSSANVYAFLTPEYNPYDLCWDNMKSPIAAVSSAYGNNANPIYNMDVLRPVQHWYQWNERNNSGSKIGSLEFISDKEGQWGYHTWVAENDPSMPRSDEPMLTINYNDYGFSEMHVNQLENNKVDKTATGLGVAIRNTGRNTWGSDVRLSYHVYKTNGELVNYDGVRTSLPRNVGAGGDYITFGANFTYPSAPGDYIIKWDLVHEGVTWFSSQSLPTYDMQIRVDDYPEYAAVYTDNNNHNMTVSAGSTILLPTTVTNNSRYDWSKDNFMLGYHWVDAATGSTYYYDGTPQNFDRTIRAREDAGTINLNVKVPINAGVYKLRLDMIRRGVTWFSNAGTPSRDYDITVTNPSFSTLNHFGKEKYYTLSGPVDLATGNLTYSSVDVSVPSQSGMLSLARSYNSAALDDIYSHDNNGYIRNWLLNGPYRENDGHARLDKAFIANEQNVRPTSGTTSSNNLWFKAPSSDLVLNLNSALDTAGSMQNGYANNVTTYAHSYIYSSVNMEAKIKIGSDDGVKLWLNSALIETFYGDRGITVDSDIFNINLKKGWNSLLLKVANNGGGYSLSARFTDMNDNVISNLKYAVDNQDIFGVTPTMGKGWLTLLDEKLVTADESYIYHRNSTGAVNIYTKNIDGTYKKPAGSSTDLIKNINGTYAVVDKDGLKSVFSNDGILLQREDLVGNKVVYDRNVNGKITKIVDGSRYLVLTYENSLLKSVTDQLGNGVTYNYDMNSMPPRLLAATDALSNSYKYEYSTTGKMTKFIDKNNNPINIFYDLNNRVSKIEDALGGSSSIKYTINDNGATAEITDAKSRISKAIFDKNNLLIDYTNPENYKEFYQYDGNYNLITAIPNLPENDFLFYRYTNKFDSNDNLIVATNPMAQTTTNEFIGNDLVRTTDPNGVSNSYNYSIDGKRLLVSATDANGNTIKYKYNAYGKRSAVIASDDSATLKEYSKDGDLIKLTAPKGEVTSFEYNAVGNKIKEISALGKVVQFQYDKASRIKKMIDPGGLVSAFEYDNNGNIIKEIDPKGNVKQKQFDALNRPVKTIDKGGAVTINEYDVLGNKTKIIESSGKATAFEYDIRDRLVKTIDVTGGTVTLEYDRNGNVSKTKDLNGNILTQTVNKLGAPTKVESADGSINISYDNNGNPININSSSSGITTLAYDNNQNILDVDSTENGSESYTYNSNNMPIEVTGQTANIITQYDLNQNVSQVSTKIGSSEKMLTTGLQNDADGKTTEVNKSNGDKFNYYYDSSGRVTKMVNTYDAGYKQDTTTYGYDANSNVITTNTNGTVKHFVYDARDQLIEENDIKYTYDISGNRLSRSNGKLTTQYYYGMSGDVNRLSKVVLPNGSGAINYQYDKNGNTIAKSKIYDGPAQIINGLSQSSENITKYYYDSDNYFVRAELADGSIVEYKYDQVTKLRSSRIETTAGGERRVTKFVYNGNKLISETSDSGVALRTYVWDKDESLVSVSVPSATGELRTYYYLKNGHGDVVGITDEKGRRVASYEYDAWGNITKTIGLDVNNPDLFTSNPRLYAGYWYDYSLGLYFMKSRMYDPSIGRFLSQDSMVASDESLDLNPYIYCVNNPMTHVDPSGNFLIFAPLIIYAPVIMASLYMLVNTPVLQAFVADDIGTIFNGNASKKDKIIASVGLMLNFAPEAKAPVSAGVKSGLKGKAGEAAARQFFNAVDYVKEPRVTSARTRIIDIAFDYKSISYFGEVKNVAYQSLTLQLKDTMAIAKDFGVTPALIVNEGTTLSRQLLDAERNRLIDIFRIPMPY